MLTCVNLKDFRTLTYKRTVKKLSIFMVFSINDNSRNLIVTKFGTRNILKVLRQDLLTSFSINIISIYRYSYLQLFSSKFPLIPFSDYLLSLSANLSQQSVLNIKSNFWSKNLILYRTLSVFCSQGYLFYFLHSVI